MPASMQKQSQSGLQAPRGQTHTSCMRVPLTRVNEYKLLIMRAHPTEQLQLANQGKRPGAVPPLWPSQASSALGESSCSQGRCGIAVTMLCFPPAKHLFIRRPLNIFAPPSLLAWPPQTPSSSAHVWIDYGACCACWCRSCRRPRSARSCWRSIVIRPWHLLLVSPCVPSLTLLACPRACCCAHSLACERHD